jgi:subtilisin family serine protease
MERKGKTWLRWRWIGLGMAAVLVVCPASRGPGLAGGAGASGVPRPSATSLPWGLERIHAPQAWQITTGCPEVIVAVIDSGIDTTIPALAAVLWTNPGEIPGNGVDDDRNGYVDDIHGWDFRDGDASSVRGSRLHWHGTFVAGVIAGRQGEGEAAGVAPNVRLMDLRFLDSRGLFTTRDWDRLVRAIAYAVDNGARIINLSVFAKVKPPVAVEQALARAAAKGVIVVGIAGNEAKPEVMYPGRYATVLAVSATDSSDGLASFSSWGPEVALAAPGREIASFLPGGAVARHSGTSFAAPHVSGTLALILSVAPELRAAEATDVLLKSCTLLTAEKDPRFGVGLVNAGAAVARASQEAR